MKYPVISLLASWLLMHASLAQIEIPGYPGKFKTRSTGGNNPGGASIIPKDNETTKKARYVTYIVLSESRQWTSTDGKVIMGKLIAFEDITVEGTQGVDPSSAPEPPKKPTVTREEKIRLLINQKPVEILLKRLSQADQEFIAKVKTGISTKSP